MRSISVFLLTLAALISHLPGRAQRMQITEMAGQADMYLTRMEPFGFNGTVLIACGEHILLNKGYGLADPSSQLPNGPDIGYSLGSIVKPFTATLVMHLVQEGRLSTDDQIKTFFSEAPLDKASVTIHQLLSHSSGLPGAVGPDDEFITKEDYLKRVWDATPDFEPGANYQYSNVGYTLLAMIIEKVTGRSYEEYLREKILVPAGMMHTGYTMVDWERARVAHNSSGGKDNGTFLERAHYPTWHLIGNGGMLSTTADMHQFYQLLKGDKLLSDDIKERMFTPVFMEDAYGWVNIDRGDILQHNGGSSDGNGALFRWFPKDDICMMIFTNSTFQNRPGFEAVQQPLEDILFGQEVAMPPEVPPYESGSMDQCKGSYKSADGSLFDIHADLKTLQIVPKNQQALSLFFNSPNGSIDWIGWNEKLHHILKTGIEKGDFVMFGDITGNPDQLKREILNEIQMEGYNKPEIRVLYSLEKMPGSHVSVVAISEDQFQGEWLLLHMHFNDGQFIGMGVNFGEMGLPELTLIPVSDTQFTAYNFNLHRGGGIEFEFDNPTGLKAISVNDGPVIRITRL